MHRNSDLELALLEYDAERYFMAEKFAQYCLAKDPEDGPALEVLGLSQVRSGALELGIDSLEHAALLCVISKEAQLALAIAYGGVGRTELSRDLLMSAATGSDLNDRELLVVAAGLEAVDEPVLAMEACRQAGVMAPENAEVHFQMGYYASRCEYPSSVIEALMRHAIGLEPQNLNFRIGLSSLLIRLERSTEAIKILAPLIPDRLEEVTCVCCLKRIANLFFDCGEFELAKLCSNRRRELTGDTASPRVETMENR
ncbi:MAG: hypothetical protein AAFX06_29105 [Planctomycetota bacterium]